MQKFKVHSQPKQLKTILKERLKGFLQVAMHFHLPEYWKQFL